MVTYLGLNSERKSQSKIRIIPTCDTYFFFLDTEFGFFITSQRNQMFFHRNKKKKIGIVMMPSANNSIVINKVTLKKDVRVLFFFIHRPD